MAKQFSDVVSYVRNGVELNALVVQSSSQSDGEHLTLVYLDPAFASGLMGSSAVDSAVAKAFALPLQAEGKNGWKEVTADAEVASLKEQLETANHEFTALSLTRDNLETKLETADREFKALELSRDNLQAKLDTSAEETK